MANTNFGIVPGNKSNQTKSGCPSTLRVVGVDTPWLRGYYEITNQTRRGQPVWHNKEKYMYILVAKNFKWQIKNSKHYFLDDTLSLAFSEATLSYSGKVWCPQGYVYTAWVNQTWITDHVRVLGKIKF